MSRTIAILGGTGPLGSGLARRWAHAGESVIIGSRDPGRAEHAAAALGRDISGAITGAANLAAVSAAEVVVLSVPFEAHAALLKEIKPAFQPGAIVIDPTVPLASSVGGRATRTLGVWQGSAAEQTAELLPAGVSVAAAFHNLPAQLLSGDQPIDCDVIVCTDDDRARHVTCELAEKIPGVRALNGGALENARILEQITALLVTLNFKYRVHSAGLRITGLPIDLPRGQA